MVSSQVLPKEPLKLLAKKREEKVLFFNFLLILGGLEKMKNVTNSKKMSIYNCQKIGQKSYLKRGLLLKLSSGYHLKPSKHDGQQHVNYRYPIFSKSPYLQLCKSTDEQQKDVVFVCAGNSLRFVSEYWGVLLFCYEPIGESRLYCSAKSRYDYVATIIPTTAGCNDRC